MSIMIKGGIFGRKVINCNAQLLEDKGFGTYLHLLKKLLCLVCCHAAAGNRGSTVFLWREAAEA